MTYSLSDSDSRSLTSELEAELPPGLSILQSLLPSHENEHINTLEIDGKSFYYPRCALRNEESLEKLKLFSVCRASCRKTVLTLLMNGDFHEI